MASPIPRLAPVIRAILFFKEKSTILTSNIVILSCRQSKITRQDWKKIVSRKAAKAFIFFFAPGRLCWRI